MKIADVAKFRKNLNVIVIKKMRLSHTQSHLKINYIIEFIIQLSFL